MFSSLLAFLTGEWDGFSHAPLFVAAAVALCAAVVGWIVHYIYERRIEMHSSRIEVLQERQNVMGERLREFEQALGANSPGDALIKIGELTATISALSIGRWTAPTGQQTEGMRAWLRELPPSEIQIRVAYDARALGRALGTIFEQLGWKVRGSKWMGGDPGISIYPRSAAAEAVAEMLGQCAGLEVAVRDNMPTRPLTLDIGEKPW
jgi:hypothetical protein